MTRIVLLKRTHPDQVGSWSKIIFYPSADFWHEEVSAGV